MAENTTNTEDREVNLNERPTDEDKKPEETPAEGVTPETGGENQEDADKNENGEKIGEDLDAIDTETIAGSDAEESMSIATEDEEASQMGDEDEQSEEAVSEGEYDMSFAQTSTIATLLPDEILNFCRVRGKERRRFECVLLLADVSGFTALTERYTLTGKGGTYYMTKTLNSYLGKMVQEILVNGGDVLKFSGDAFLACWKVFEDDQMPATVMKTVKCALFIQRTLGEYETDVNVSLRVKLAISAGTATFSVIGDEDIRHYIIVGDPITEIRLAEYMCASGEVLLSPSAWKFCDSEKYQYFSVGEYGHIKITEEEGGGDFVPPPPKKDSKKKKGEEKSDLMFLVIFGLRGSSHDMETQNGLICAAYCHQQLKLLIGVKAVSIGVTTGMAYCGVVGHPMRREYTVLGSTVNKAARIMVAYQGKITCDRSTFIQSKLSAASFSLQETKELKGLSTVDHEEPLEYLTEMRQITTIAISDVEVTPWPLLGRDTAINLYYSKFVSLLIHKKMKDKKLKHTVLHSGIVFYGEPRIGKTRLLEDLANLTRAQDYPCVLASLTSAHRRAPYAAAAYLFQLIIGIDHLANAKEKEEIISSYFGLELKASDLCYLNDIFQIKLTLTDDYKDQSEEERAAKRIKVAKKLLNLCCLAVAPVVVIALDDIHHMDPPSALLFASFLDCDNILFVFTATADIPLELANVEEFESEGVLFLQIGESQSSFAKFYEHPRLFHYPLTGLPLECMAPLACQMLEVRGISSELEKTYNMCFTLSVIVFHKLHPKVSEKVKVCTRYID
ncbi:hypothetical protein J437_LFUL014950 [Ladona fulva]|uniref:Guanylate cyclase domain-containing protein n=1 Tax=Ladona fulva TaxID=123851 RepID=A0A8K0KFY0_LADFU|nr:hypothetical protein J437_LFUL014950 [Ladona fulva]